MASQLFFRRARNPTSAIKSLLYNISLAPKSVSISSSPFSTLSSKFSILNPKPSKPSLPVPAPKSISPFSTLSSTFSPPLPVPVDFVGKPPVAGFSYLQRSRYNTESLGFKVVAQFKLDEMKHTVYKDNIQKIRNLFPVADPSDHRFGMLRTACPILDKLPFANKFFFIEMSVESLPPLYLLASKEMGRVVAVKGGKNLVLERNMSRKNPTKLDPGIFRRFNNFRFPNL